MAAPRTMGDHIEATRLRVHGPRGEEATSSWDRRVGDVVFDGRPLRDHELIAAKEPSKLFTRSAFRAA